MAKFPNWETLEDNQRRIDNRISTLQASLQTVTEQMAALAATMTKQFGILQSSLCQRENAEIALTTRDGGGSIESGRMGNSNQDRISTVDFEPAAATEKKKLCAFKVFEEMSAPLDTTARDEGVNVDGFRFDLASIITKSCSLWDVVHGYGKPIEGDAWTMGTTLINPPLVQLISNDPVLHGVKIIAEAWDPGGLYQVGHLPSWGIYVLAKVLRAGTWSEQDASILVPGDIISITLGYIIPADCRLLEGRSVRASAAAEMVKGFRVHELGGPEVLKWEDVEIGEPKEGEIRVKNQAIGVNFVDVNLRKGVHHGKLPLPFTPGVEAVGVVIAIDPGSSERKLGDVVAYAGQPVGSYSEEQILPDSVVVPVPPSIDYNTAASVMVKGMTAHMLLRYCFKVEPGHAVLVHAADGGVGSLLCQWANVLRATVIGTVSSERNAAQAAEDGCHHVIIYTKEDFVTSVDKITSGNGVHVVYDSVGKGTFQGSMKCLASRGYMISFRMLSGRPDPVPLIDLALKSLFLTAIGNFCICSIAIGMIVEIIVRYPIQKKKYRDGIDNLLVLLIGGIPIAMTNVLSVTMAIESHRLSQQGAITKRMTAIEEMAGRDVPCSDKTGTLTLNKLSIDKNLIEVFANGVQKDDAVLLAAYKLLLPYESKIHPVFVFHVSLLKRYKGDPLTAGKMVLPSESFNNRPVHLPEVVKQKRQVLSQGELRDQVLIKWQGLHEEHNSWEWAEDILQLFPYFDLEDKVHLGGGSNDTIQQAREPKVTPPKMTRARQKPRWLQDYA